MPFLNENPVQTKKIGIFCYHKAGTVLLTKVFGHICVQKRMKLACLYGKQTQLPRNADMFLFYHSLVDFRHITAPLVGVHFVRDPRDIIVSGYLYHSRTSEEWCVNSDFSQKAPIRYPRIPFSQQHRSHEWKIKYLNSLNGISYQNNLLNMSQRDGLLFEMNNYGAWTIESMKEWNYNRNNILEIKFESLMDNYDDTFRAIFEYLGFSKIEIKRGMLIAAEHDLGRKSDQQIKQLKHVSSKKTSKWADYFEPEHKKTFIKKFGDVLIDLGYENDNNW